MRRSAYSKLPAKLDRERQLLQRNGKRFGRPLVLDAGQRQKIAERYAAGETISCAD